MVCNTLAVATSFGSAAAARLSTVAAATFVAQFAALHLIKPQLDPRGALSASARSAARVVARGVCVPLVALACAALITAIKPDVTTVLGYIGLEFLVRSTPGLVLAAVFTIATMLLTSSLVLGACAGVGPRVRVLGFVVLSGAVLVMVRQKQR